MTEKKNTILITGARGFIGSFMTGSFEQAGFQTVPVDREEADLSVPDTLTKVIGNRTVEAVIHAASIRPQTGASLNDYRRFNVATLENVLNWMRKSGVKKIIHFSSINVYGNIRDRYVTEETPPDPAGDYAVSKWEADCLLKERTSRDGLTSVSLRLPSVFGRIQGGGFIENCLASALKNEEIEIYSMGKLWRNLIHIDELVGAVKLIVTAWKGWSGPRLFLLGSANSLTQETIVRRIVEKSASRSAVKLVDKTAPADADWLIRLDRAKAAFGFKPLPLEEMLDRYVAQNLTHAL